MKCVKCGCTEEKACEGGCVWVSKDPPLCSRCATGLPVFTEAIGAALIDSARISIMAALQAFPPPPESKIVAVGQPELPDEPTVFDCLAMAMEWLDGARSLTVQRGAPVTSLHVITPP